MNDYADFQRDMLSHLPSSAIPRMYTDGTYRALLEIENPIHPFSFRADEKGVFLNSPVQKVSIHWSDVVFIEEVDFKVKDEVGDSRVPRVHIVASDGAFELTRFWTQYDLIRDLAFAKSPDCLVLAW